MKDVRMQEAENVKGGGEGETGARETEEEKNSPSNGKYNRHSRL